MFLNFFIAANKYLFVAYTSLLNTLYWDTEIVVFLLVCKLVYIIKLLKKV